MPYSFTQIEKDRSRTIAWVFSSLIVFYFLTGWVIALLVKNYNLIADAEPVENFTPALLTLPETLTALVIALAVAGVHWLVSVQGMVERILRVLQAEPLNPKDTHHQMLANIIEEVSVATGGRSITGVVVPTPAMNAFALSDFGGQAIIGVTEGLLGRLNRAQLEAVVGHEAAHVVSEDCTTTTVTTALFGLINGLLNAVTIGLRGSGRSSSRSRGGNGFVVFLLLVYFILAVTRLVSLLFNMFISRQREYRADAIAVRLTRDPLSLAQALYIISSRWRGGGMAGEELEALFITNPRFSQLDESEGFFSELFSTHPPVEKRIQVLLDMARTDVKTLEESVKGQETHSRQDVPLPGPVLAKRWLVNQNGAWTGPFTLSQLATLQGLGPNTWVKPSGSETVIEASDDQDINSLLKEGGGRVQGSMLCPRCQVPLTEMAYEGTLVAKCSSCGGTLVAENDVQRILVRREVGFSDRVAHLAGLLQRNRVPASPGLNLRSANLSPCPHCPSPKPKMIHMLYTMAYPVEIDRCLTCGFLWFDRDELEVLQYLIEKRVAPV